MNNKKKGFTLVEVLGILVILAIIALIAVPSILKVVRTSKEDAVKSTAQILARAAQDYYSSQILLTDGIDKVSLTDDTLVYNGNKPDMGYAFFDEEGRAYIKMYYDGYCVVRNYDGTVEMEEVIPSNCAIADMVAITLYGDGGQISVTDKWSVGEDFVSIIIEFATTLDKLPTVEKIGHTFLGWWDEEGNSVNLAKPVTENIIATAKWDPNKYTITLDTTGGIVEGDYEKVREIVYGTEYGDLPEPTRFGYIFRGWYTAGGTEINSDTLLSNPNDHTIYANWEAITYELVLDGNGGSLPSAEGWTTTVGKAYKDVLHGTKYENLLTPFKEGYTFKGWYTVDGILINENVMVESALTLYASWEANQYVVTFNTNGGNVIESIDVTYDNAYGTLPTPTKTGHKFLGWYTLGGVKVEETDIVKIISDTTLYADWKLVVYTVTFNADGGTIPSSNEYTLINNSTASKQVTYENLYGTLPTPTKTGYTFNGWVTSGGSVILATDTVKITSDTNLYAQWGNNTYLVTYNGNGGTPSVPTLDVTYDKAYGTLATASRSGYTFNGWYYNGSKIESTTKVSVADNHTLTANWGANTYTVTFVYNNGSSNTTKTVTYDSKYDTLPTPTKKGYIFNGWYTTGGTHVTSDTLVTVAENHSLSAQWIANEHTVTFNPNTGIVSTTSKVVMTEFTYGELPTPTKTGYTFEGWYTSSTGGTKIESTTVVTLSSDQELFAHWTVNTYTVTFVYNDNITSNTTKTVTYDSTYGTLPNPGRTGYTFNGWYTTGGTKIESSTKVTITSAQTLSAQWTANNYTVTFVYGNGTANTTKSVTYDSTYGTLPAPTRTGYTFNGWYSGSTKYESTTTVKITSAQTLTASWTARTFTITFNSNGGSIASGTSWTGSGTSATKNVTYDSTYGALPTATKVGYTFHGWATSSGTSITADTKVTVTANTTLYAQYGVNNYLVTFDGNGGTPSKPNATLSYGSAYGTLPTASRTGYTFKGWYTAKTSGTVVTSTTTMSTASNHSIYAQWTANTYTVTFDRNNYGDGSVIYFNPVTAQVCDASEAISVSGTKTGCMKWYAFLDDGGDTIKLLLDHNTTTLSAWANSGYSTPIIANTQLQNDIASWNESIKATARLISAEEIIEIANISNWTSSVVNRYYFQYNGGEIYYGNPGTNKYAWLFDNTYNCTENGCNISQNDNYGYWTSTYMSNDIAWAIGNGGGLGFGDIYDSSFLGIRPVIEVNKSLLKLTKEVTFDSTYGALPNVEKHNYIFLGWYTEPYNGTKITNSSISNIVGEQTLYAHWQTSVTLTNLVTNGHFNNGKTDWDLPNTASISNGIITYYGSGNWSSGMGQNNAIITNKSKELIYVNLYANTTNDSFGVGFGTLPGGSYVYTTMNIDYTNNTYKAISGIIELSKDWVSTSYFGIYSAREAGTIYIDYVYAVNLTKIFGTGNEPSKSWCDSNLEYFDSTLTATYDMNSY